MHCEKSEFVEGCIVYEVTSGIFPGRGRKVRGSDLNHKAVTSTVKNASKNGTYYIYICNGSYWKNLLLHWGVQIVLPKNNST